MSNQAAREEDDVTLTWFDVLEVGASILALAAFLVTVAVWAAIIAAGA